MQASGKVKSIRLARMLSSAAMLSTIGMAQGAWLPIPAGTPNCFDHAVAFDNLRSRTILFGGNGPGTTLGDTWTLTNNTWQLLTSTGPTARWGHAMAYDVARDRVVLFGGQTDGGILFGDTWTWDGSAWQLASTMGPSPRTSCALAYDSARARTVLFGGNTGTGAQFADTWEWNGSTWVPQVQASGPAARSDHAMAFDSHRARTVLFGGTSTSDTWEWNGQQWSLRSMVGPAPRAVPAMAFDPVRRLVILQGGVMPNPAGDTWAWDGSSWQPFTAPSLPSAWHSLSYDGQRLLHVVNGSTHEWQGAPSAASIYGAGCGSPALGMAGAPGAAPQLGGVARAIITNTPTPLIAVMIGWSNQQFGPFALPVSLASIGIETCDLQTSAEVLGLAATPTGNGTADFLLGVPSVLSLVGAELFLQTYAFAPGFNTAEIVTSNGLAWRVGY